MPLSFTGDLQILLWVLLVKLPQATLSCHQKLHACVNKVTVGELATVGQAGELCGWPRLSASECVYLLGHTCGPLAILTFLPPHLQFLPTQLCALIPSYDCTAGMAGMGGEPT